MNLTLETDRLLLRPLELSDAGAFFVMNDNPNVGRYLSVSLKTKADAEAYIRKIISEYQKNGIGRCAVILKETGKMIGFSGLKFRPTEENGYSGIYDLGYRFAEEHWRKGFATEAAAAWLEYGFNDMELKTIYACAMSENIGSNEVLKKLGFQFTNEYFARNAPHNWYTIEKHNLIK